MDKKSCIHSVLNCLHILNIGLLPLCTCYDLFNINWECEKERKTGIPGDEKNIWWAYYNIFLPFFIFYVIVNTLLLWELHNMTNSNGPVETKKKNH